MLTTLFYHLLKHIHEEKREKKTKEQKTKLLINHMHYGGVCGRVGGRGDFSPLADFLCI